MKALSGYFFGGVDPIRPWLLLRLLLVLLAFDCWIDFIPHGGRYGFNDFNVAHFAILDLLPVPSAGVYVGVVCLTGLLAFAQAITRPTRVGMALLFCTYSYSWLISMLDSYQHHYLLSVLLFSCIFFPMPTGEEIFERGRPAPSRAWGGVLFAWGLLEILLGMSGVDTPLSALVGPGAAIGVPTWMWGVRFGALLLGGLLAFMPGAEKPAVPVDVPDPDPAPESAESKTDGPRKRKKGKKGKKRKANRPEKRQDEAPAPEKPKAMSLTTSAWAYVSFCVSCAIVYFYTAVTKLSPDWRGGHALRRLSRTDLFDALEARALGEGLPLLGTFTADEFWRLVAGGAILVQIVTCVGYLLAAARDRLAPRLAWLSTMLVIAPISFHLGAEAGLGLDIGWFSFYMMLVPLAVFLPADVLRVLGERWSRLWARLRSGLSASVDTHGPAIPLFAGVVMVATVLLAGNAVDLPGVGTASILFVVIAGTGAAFAYRTQRLAQAAEWALGAALAGGMMWFSIAQTDARFDFYRFVGGEYRRHGEFALALDAYEKANRYVVAPWCVYETGGRRDELIECYANEGYAERIAATREPFTVKRRDRQRQEDEMRERLGNDDDD